MDNNLERVNAEPNLSLMVPHDWRRSSLAIFSNGAQDASAAGLVVRRETIDPRTSLEQYVDSVLIELARSLPSFALLDRRSRTIGEHPATELVYTISMNGVEHLQRQVCVLDIPGSALSCTASSAREHAADFEPLFDEVFASANLTARAGAPG